MDRGTSVEMPMCKYIGPNYPKYVIIGSVVGALAVSLAAYSAGAGFEYYRSLPQDREDNKELAATAKLTMPVLVLAGEIYPA